MALTHRLTQLWTGAGSERLSTQQTISGDGEDNRSVSGSGAVGNQQLDVHLAKDADNGLVSLFLLASKDMTVYTNHPSNALPDDTITLKASAPLVWTAQDSGEVASPIATAAVTKLFLTKVGAGSWTFDLRAVQRGAPPVLALSGLDSVTLGETLAVVTV